MTKEEFSKANGLVSLAGSARYLISPLLAGFLLSVSDVKLLLIIDISTFVLTVLPGQVYVPVCYESVYHVKTGDVLNIGGKELIVAGFIRDSQMNSMMASSKRFLVCAEDYEKLRPMGSEEYLIDNIILPALQSRKAKKGSRKT